jgi:hypothetical protein
MNDPYAGQSGSFVLQNGQRVPATEVEAEAAADVTPVNRADVADQADPVNSVAANQKPKKDKNNE